MASNSRGSEKRNCHGRSINPVANCSTYPAVAWLGSLAGEVGDQMSMMLKMSAEPGYLHARATGKFSLAEAKRTFIEMLEAVARNKVRKILFDGRGLAGSPKFMERFYYGKFAAETVVQFGARGVSTAIEFAYVLEVPMRDFGRFGENVAHNRGMRVMTFDNLNDALGWLLMAPANKADAGDGR